MDPTKKTPRARVKWTPEEEACMWAGIQKHGIGAWAVILADPVLEFNAIRTPVDLKDKYRNCVSSRRGKKNPPPPLALDSVPRAPQSVAAFGRKRKRVQAASSSDDPGLDGGSNGTPRTVGYPVLPGPSHGQMATWQQQQQPRVEETTTTTTTTVTIEKTTATRTTLATAEDSAAASAQFQFVSAPVLLGLHDSGGRGAGTLGSINSFHYPAAPAAADSGYYTFGSCTALPRAAPPPPSASNSLASSLLPPELAYLGAPPPPEVAVREQLVSSIARGNAMTAAILSATRATFSAMCQPTSEREIEEAVLPPGSDFLMARHHPGVEYRVRSAQLGGDWYNLPSDPPPKPLDPEAMRDAVTAADFAGDDGRTTAMRPAPPLSSSEYEVSMPMATAAGIPIMTPMSVPTHYPRSPSPSPMPARRWPPAPEATVESDGDSIDEDAFDYSSSVTSDAASSASNPTDPMTATTPRTPPSLLTSEARLAELLQAALRLDDATRDAALHLIEARAFARCSIRLESQSYLSGRLMSETELANVSAENGDGLYDGVRVGAAKARAWIEEREGERKRGKARPDPARADWLM
ncbi:hypothetical protein BC828DRAFT_392871 [Blastocladiella britannica]|nr:hypothetical protein BC828DRAFT_392871 [Blastocladiella britannica]